jgi:hypothetical protein
MECSWKGEGMQRECPVWGVLQLQNSHTQKLVKQSTNKIKNKNKNN